MKKVGKSLVARQTKKGETFCTSTEVIAYLLYWNWEANDFSKPVRDFKEFYRGKPEVIEILNMIDLVIKANENTCERFHLYGHMPDRMKSMLSEFSMGVKSLL